MDKVGGRFSQEVIFVTELPEYVKSSSIKVYDEESLKAVYTDASENGFSFIIIPATSSIHASFAINGPSYLDFATKPLIGWISGVFLDDLGKQAPKVFDGSTAKSYDDMAVVMHIALPKNKLAQIHILNIFDQGSGDTINFSEDSFSATDAIVNGKSVKFADFIQEKSIDIKLPLVADMYGAKINTSFQSIDEATKVVSFYAPVFKGVDYKIAAHMPHYIETFTSMIPKDISDSLFFSCNCILNYIYAELEGKQTSNFTGPITFGEIAYQLLNQTMAYITIDEA
jgi:hypothetical protein